jgi:hypothetical protein
MKISVLQEAFAVLVSRWWNSHESWETIVRARLWDLLNSAKNAPSHPLVLVLNGSQFQLLRKS